MLPGFYFFMRPSFPLGISSEGAAAISAQSRSSVVIKSSKGRADSKHGRCLPECPAERMLGHPISRNATKVRPASPAGGRRAPRGGQAAWGGRGGGGVGTESAGYRFLSCLCRA